MLIFLFLRRALREKFAYERRNLAWIFIILFMVTAYDISTHHKLRLLVGHGEGDNVI